jgi:hypothetical protein
MDLLFRGAVIASVELVEEVRVGAERHGRGVSGLPRDLDDGGALGDEQADVGVPQVVWTSLWDAGLCGRIREGALASFGRDRRSTVSRRGRGR